MDVFITNLVAIISFELSVIDQNGGLATILGIAEQGSVLPDTINVAIQDDSTKVGNRGGKASKQASQPASQPASRRPNTRPACLPRQILVANAGLPLIPISSNVLLLRLFVPAVSDQLLCVGNALFNAVLGDTIELTLTCPPGFVLQVPPSK